MSASFAADEYLELVGKFMTPRAIYRAACLLCVTAALGWPQRDLGEASLEELLNTKITSVSKKEQTLSRAAAAFALVAANFWNFATKKPSTL